MYTLGQAAKATGRAKVTLARAIKSGRISAARGPDGSYAIDPSELARVYPLTGEPASEMGRSAPGNGLARAPDASPGEVAALHQRITEQAETIRDLRDRLDASEAERRHEREEHRRVQERLTGLLTHRQSGSVPIAPGATIRRPWWRWLR